MPRISFHYLASLTLTLAVRLSGHIKVVISSVHQLWIYQSSSKYSQERGHTANITSGRGVSDVREDRSNDDMRKS